MNLNFLNLNFLYTLLNFILSIFSDTSTVSVDPVLVVKTEYGLVQGSFQYIDNSTTYKAFKGIPYAAPPTGKKRFQAPVAPKRWRRTLKAELDAPVCMQSVKTLNTSLIVGQEDCLYLNIYVPHTKDATTLLPVMVFIHGGSFLFGTGASFIFGPEFLVSKEVILVTMNYRLGVFGFLSTLDDNAPGNYAFKDQAFALEFVYKNIKNFGGDENRITIFGQSAGSVSVDLHTVSPLSRRFFTQAICQSGSALNSWALPANDLHKNMTANVVDAVECSQFLGDNNKVVKCLKNVDANVLITKFMEAQPFNGVILLPFYLVVSENRTRKNPNPFLEKSPFEYIKSGNFKKVPAIYGTVQDEALGVSSSLLRDQNLRNIINSKFYLVLTTFMYLEDNSQSQNILKNAIQFYMDGKDYVETESVQGFADMLSDRWFVYGIYQNVLLRAKQNQKNIWLYNFDYRGKKNVASGVTHGAELPYLFTSDISGDDLKMKDDLTTMWTDFAKYGNPDPKKNFKWDKLHFFFRRSIKSKSLTFFNITGSFGNEPVYKMQKGFRTKRMDFWSKQNIKENKY